MKTLSANAILYEDNHLIAVNKRAGIAIQNSGQDLTLPDLIKQYLKNSDDNQKQNPWLGILHRLDQNVSGVTVFAKNSKSASRISKMIRERKVEKIYLALVTGDITPAKGNLIHYHIKNHARARLYTEPVKDSKKAILAYQKLKILHNHSLLLIKLETGLYHQIRAQFAFIRHPIKGDIKYQRRKTLSHEHLFLHHIQMTVCHPVTEIPLHINAPLPPIWKPYVTIQELEQIKKELNKATCHTRESINLNE